MGTWPLGRGGAVGKASSALFFCISLLNCLNFCSVQFGAGISVCKSQEAFKGEQVNKYKEVVAVFSSKNASHGSNEFYSKICQMH